MAKRTTASVQCSLPHVVSDAPDARMHIEPVDDDDDEEEEEKKEESALKSAGL